MQGLCACNGCRWFMYKLPISYNVEWPSRYSSAFLSREKWGSAKGNRKPSSKAIPLLSTPCPTKHGKTAMCVVLFPGLWDTNPRGCHECSVCALWAPVAECPCPCSLLQLPLSNSETLQRSLLSTLWLLSLMCRLVELFQDKGAGVPCTELRLQLSPRSLSSPGCIHMGGSSPNQM